MEIIHANDKNSDQMIRGEVLLDFYADWCGPCKMLAPVLDQIKDRIQIIKINVDESPALAKKYGVMTIPALFHINEGKTNQTVGFLPKEELLKWLNK